MTYAQLFHLTAPARNRPDYTVEAFLLQHARGGEGDLHYHHLLTGFRMTEEDPSNPRYIVQARGPVIEALGGKTSFRPWRVLLNMPWEPLEFKHVPQSVRDDLAAAYVINLSEEPPQWRVASVPNPNPFVTRFIDASTEGFELDAARKEKLHATILGRMQVENV